MLNGPGFSSRGPIFLLGSQLAIIRPTYSETICPAKAEIVIGDDRNQKNWFTNARKAQMINPMIHVLAVSIGKSAVSVVGTVRLTSSMEKVHLLGIILQKNFCLILQFDRGRKHIRGSYRYAIFHRGERERQNQLGPFDLMMTPSRMYLGRLHWLHYKQQTGTSVES